MTSNPTPEIDRHWQLAHPGFIVLQAFATLRSLAFPFAAIFLARGMWRDPFSPASLAFLGISAGVLLISVVISWMEWRFYRYTLAPDRVIVRSGWISRKEREIPYQRIQSVDVKEGPVYRLLGLAELMVDTAGGGGLEAELQIKALPKAAAMDLRDQLLRYRVSLAAQQAPVSSQATAPGSATEADQTLASQPEVLEGELIRQLSTRDLVLAGATSGTIAPTLAVFGTIIGFGEQFLPRSVWDRIPWETGERALSSPATIALAIAVLGMIAWIMAIIGTVLTYSGFEIRRQDDYLFVQHGLLDRRRKTIPIHRIQAVEMNEGLLRLPFGLCELEYHRAGGSLQEDAGSGVLFPLMHIRDVSTFLKSAAPEYAQLGTPIVLNPPPLRAKRRYIVGPTIALMLILTLAGVALYRWANLPVESYAILPLILLVPIVVGYLSWRDAGWYIGVQDVVLRNRGFARSTTLLPRARIQEREVTANAFQRRADVANLRLRVAGGSFGIRHLDARIADWVMATCASRRQRTSSTIHTPSSSTSTSVT